MKLILKDGQEFDIKNISRNYVPKDTDSIVITFVEEANIDSLITVLVDEVLSEITVRNGEITKTYTGYKYDRITESMSDDSSTSFIILSLNKKLS